MHEFLKSKKIYIAAFLAAIILLFYFTPLKRQILFLAKPVNGLGQKFYSIGAGVGNYYILLKKGPGLLSELADKNQIIAGFDIKNLHYQNLEEENLRLKKILNYAEAGGQKVVMAKIISQRELFGKTVLTVNAGSDKGVAEDFPAIIGDKILAGKISHVVNTYSLVLPTLDPSSAIAATIAGKESAQGVVRGVLGVSLIMELITQEVKIEPGDLVVTSLLEKNTPPGLIIGKIAKIEYIEGELFQKAEVEPITSLTNMNTLNIILPD